MGGSRFLRAERKAFALWTWKKPAGAEGGNPLDLGSNANDRESDSRSGKQSEGKLSDVRYVGNVRYAAFVVVS